MNSTISQLRQITLLCLWLLPALLQGQVIRIASWNIQDLGRTKDAAEIAQMVQILRTYDLVLIQEVVAKDPAGAQAVASLADGLNRTGSRWDYRISDPTQSPSPQLSERYAMLWKPSRLQLLGRASLDASLAAHCYREPMLARFRLASDTSSFWVVNFHARTHDQQPEEEISWIVQLPRRLAPLPVIIAGDFNLNEQHNVWQPIYQLAYQPALRQTPTTLKRACNEAGQYFNHPIDNLYVPTRHFRIRQAGRVDIVGSCSNLEPARALSDHVPVWVEVELAE